MRRHLVSLALLAGALAIGAATSAWAHAFLDHASPAVGSTVAAAPAELQLFFTQELEPAFSGVTLSSGDGRAIATGAAAIDPQNRAEMVLKLPPLAPGHYRVSWHAVSVDTHRTEGAFTFDVQP
ncbi:MAG TPA: copper homeostasis periplasmic binding protein CopC [Stellaceae bacterium]|nr:copper homeostasis periplasmic binding protein CopC [Stellaceae bacterium]